jgi:CRISPR-associated protein Csm3
MSNERQKPILGKILITGSLRCETGLHIGSSKDNLEIGGLDSPVVRDPISREPYIPGSSLRGKMRSIFEKKEGLPLKDGKIKRHECSEKSCVVCRLFGSASGGDKNQPARLAIRDSRLTQNSISVLASIDTGLQYTELKFENSLDRITSAADPRQIERVPAGAEFKFEMVYTVETREKQQVVKDIQNVLGLLNMLQDDSLGGQGSRGYGKIAVLFPADQNALVARKSGYYTGEDKTTNEKSLAVQSIDQALADVEQMAEFFALE